MGAVTRTEEQPVYAPERHAEIVTRARRDGRVDVNRLARDLDVTSETIRRDLTQLERRGVLRRVHGGAIPVERLILEPSVAERQDAHVAAKEAIARAALAELAGVRTILLDGGTTTAQLAAILPTDRELTVITNAFPLASRVANQPNITLHLVGGVVRGRTLASVGPWATAALATLHADVAFLGTNGITVEHGLTTADITEAEMKSTLLRAARRTVVLADHSKVGRDELVTWASLDQIDTLITDAAVDADLAFELEEAGVDVRKA